MDFRETLICKIISAVVVFIFAWTSAGGMDYAWAASGQDKPNPASPPAYAKKDKSSAARHAEALEGMRKALKDEKLSIKDKKAKVASLMDEVKAQDKMLREEFKATGKRLKEKGLSGKIRKRHRDFVKHYESNMAELKKNVRAVSKAHKSEFKGAADKALKHLDKVKPPKRHSPFNPNKLPVSATKELTAPVIKRSAMNYDESYDYYAELERERLDRPVLLAATGDLSGIIDPGYLAETVEVKFTQEITDLATELGNDPIKMYEWVRNYIKYEPYYGSIKGARQTLMEKAGNDYDQASLLLALYRSSGIPARYASGTVEMPVEQAMNWVGGAKTPEVAGKIFATNSIPSKLLVEGGVIKYISLEQVWVEAWVDMEPSLGALAGSGGKRWTPISPSFKEMYIQEGKDIAKELPFDEEAYLSHLTNTPPLADYLNQLDDYYTSVYKGFFIESLHGTVVMPKRFEIFAGTLPYMVKSVGRKFEEVPSGMRHTVGLGLMPEYGEMVTVNKHLAEIAGRKVTLSYASASDIDSATIASYGGLLNTPAYLVQVTPQIKIEDTVILTGEAMTLGGKLSLRTDLNGPAANWPRAVETKEVSYGIHFAIGITALDYPSMQRHNNSKKLLDMEGRLSDSLNAMDDDAGVLLHNMIIEYFAQFTSTNKSLEGVHSIIDVKMPSLALLSATVDYGVSFGVAMSPPTMDGFTTDAYYLMSSPTALNGEAASRKAFLEQSGLASSYLEHRTVENLLIDVPNVLSFSTIKIMQIAKEQGIEIVDVSKSNIASILPTLEIAEFDKQLITDSVNNGKIVMVPTRNIDYNWFKGLGLIVRDPATGAGAYLISHGFYGSRTRSDDPAARDSAGYVAAVISGRPHKLEGLLDVPHRMGEGIRSYVLQAPEIGYIAVIIMSHGYTPYLIFEATDDEIKNVLELQNLWLFSYTGHGYSDEASAAINENLPLIALEPESNFVKFVFPNSCGGGMPFSLGEFVDAFKIDGLYDPDGKHFQRDEAVVGWDCEAVMAGFAFEFGSMFWYKFASGKSVSESVEDVNISIDATYREIGKESDCHLVFSGTPNTRIWP